MALAKRTPPQKAARPERAPEVKAMPFPGESPTVSLAMAAARMYGLPPEEEKPARSAPKRKRAAKRPAKSGGKAKAKTPVRRARARA